MGCTGIPPRCSVKVNPQSKRMLLTEPYGNVGGKLSKASLFWRVVGGGENDDSNEISHTVYGEFLNRKKNLSRQKISSQIVKENLSGSCKSSLRFLLRFGVRLLVYHSAQRKLSGKVSRSSAASAKGRILTHPPTQQCQNSSSGQRHPGVLLPASERHGGGEDAASS